MRIWPPLKLAPAATPAPPTEELGDTGTGYKAGSSATLKRLSRLGEYNYDLRGSSGIAVYDRMRFSDPKVAGLRRAQNLPLLSAGVRIEPADPDDGRAKEVAEFVTSVLLSEGRLACADPWVHNLRQFLLALDYGHAGFELVWALRDGKAVIERFAYRPPATIQDVYVERGRIDHVTQVADTGQEVEIPGEKLVWFCHEREGDDFFGRPLLRPMYKPWYNKEKAEVILLILLEKTGGIPYARETAEASLTPTQKDSLDDALEAMHVSDRGYLRVPPGVDVSLLSGNIDLAEGLELVRYWDQQLSTVSQQQFLDLGQAPNGSRALSMNLSDMYLNSLGSVAKDIEDTMNAPEGPIAQLVAYNFAGAEDLAPKLRFASLGKLDLKAMAAGLFQLYQMGMPFADRDWEWIREELDLPENEATDAPPRPREADEQTPPAREAASQNEDGPPAGGTTASECSCRAAESGYWRALRPEETYVALDEVAALFDDAKQAVREATQKTRDRITIELARRALEAAATGDGEKVAGLAAGKAPMLDVLMREIRAVFEDYFERGRVQVRDELARQRDGEPVIDEVTGERAGEVRELADPPPRMTTKEARRFYALLDTEAEVAARAIGSSSVTEAAKQAAQALVRPMSLEVATEMVRRASDETAIKVGFTITRVVIEGRTAEAAEERAQIADGVYSAILDGNVCENCEPMDGRETSDLDEAATWTPNPRCLGGERCRCVVIYRYKAGDE